MADGAAVAAVMSTDEACDATVARMRALERVALVVVDATWVASTLLSVATTSAAAAFEAARFLGGIAGVACAGEGTVGCEVRAGWDSALAARVI